MEYVFLLQIALILLFVKVFGIITNRFHMPQIIGAILAGIFLGPAVLGIVHENEFIREISQIGVIVLMFFAGLETNLTKFIKNIKSFTIIALFGVITPFVLGGLFTNYYFNVQSMAIFIGVVLTATSVSITVEALTEMKKLSSKSGQTIMGAGVVDDILGVVLLSFILGRYSMNAKPLGEIALNIGIFFIIAAVIGFIVYKIFNYIEKKNGRKRRIPILGFTFALILAFIAEYFGVSGITGAYIAGLILGHTAQREYITKKINTLIYMLLGPMFFASIGLKITNFNIDKNLLLFGGVILLIAILSKALGCYMGSRFCKIKKMDSLKIGIGMISRGEVALIMLDKGLDLNIISNEVFTVMILVTVITTLVTPLFLEIVYKNEDIIEDMVD